MSFPADMPPGDQRRLAVLSFVMLAVIVAIAAFVAVLALKGGNVAQLAKQILDLARLHGRTSPAPAGKETYHAPPIA